MQKNRCIMQVRAETEKSALPFRNYLHILYQIFEFTQNLKRSQGYWKKLAAGSTFESINSDTVYNAEIIVPPNIEESQLIGSYFLTLDSLITLHQRKAFFTLFCFYRTLSKKQLLKLSESVCHRFKNLLHNQTPDVQNI